MGLAIIVPGISFDDANLGKVTLTGNIPISGLLINLEDTYIGTAVDLECSYLPVNTTQRGVAWSIVSGSEYASISGSTLTILEGASGSNVTIRCTSTSNPSISAEKTIIVYYDANKYEWVGSVGATTPPQGMTYNTLEFTEAGAFRATNANLNINKALPNYTLEFRLAPAENRNATSPQIILCTGEGFGVKVYWNSTKWYLNVNGTPQEIGKLSSGTSFKIEHKNSQFTIYKDGVQIAQGNGYSSQYLFHTGIYTEPTKPNAITICSYFKYHVSL